LGKRLNCKMDSFYTLLEKMMDVSIYDEPLYTREIVVRPQTIMKMKSLNSVEKAASVLLGVIKEEEGLSAQQINHGKCDVFATSLSKAGYGEVIWGGDIPKKDWRKDVQEVWDFWSGSIKNNRRTISFPAYHVFLLGKDGKYYDAEAIQGVSEKEDLPEYKRWLYFIQRFPERIRK
jgi:hypothetical protein